MAAQLAGGRSDLARAVTKAGWRALPLIGLSYLVAYMDRVNISFAATQMNADLGFSATVYGLGGGLFFLSYSLFEIPSNVMMLRTGPRVWIARIMITWGLLSAAMMFVRTPSTFYALRFAIGLAEAGFFPAAVYYVSRWFPGEHRGRAISLFYLFGPLASAVMGWLSAWLLTLDGTHGLQGWQWLFLVEGLPAVAIGVLVLALLPDEPRTAPWLSEAERGALLSALEVDARRMGGEPSHDIGAVLRNPKVQWLAMMGVMSIASFYAFALSAPQILIEKTGESTASIGLLVSIGGLLGASTMLAAGWYMDRRKERFSALLFAIAVEAAALLAVAISSDKSVIFAAYLCFAGSWTVVTLAQVAIWSDVLRERQLAIGAAAINSASQMGAFASPLAFGASRDATGSYTAGLLVLPAMLAVLFVLSFVLMRRLDNQRRALALAI
jgi:ACS family tartrate transporter-like MFS transporter